MLGAVPLLHSIENPSGDKTRLSHTGLAVLVQSNTLLTWGALVFHALLQEMMVEMMAMEVEMMAVEAQMMAVVMMAA
eukprot:scaffold83438_cov13-Tisochrysis_lutea.AAC.1